MLGSILRGSHAYESLDVVLLQQNGNMHKKRKVFGNEEKKTDKRWKWAFFESCFCCLLSLSLTLFPYLNDSGLLVFLTVQRSTSLSWPNNPPPQYKSWRFDLSSIAKDKKRRWNYLIHWLTVTMLASVYWLYRSRNWQNVKYQCVHTQSWNEMELYMQQPKNSSNLNYLWSLQRKGAFTTDLAVELRLPDWLEGINRPKNSTCKTQLGWMAMCILATVYNMVRLTQTSSGSDVFLRD